MPMDGVMLGFIARELNQKLKDGRVDRIIQPERDEIILFIRAQGENRKLVLSSSANTARVHLTGSNRTGPQEPPMFCMLLRKYLIGGRVLSVSRIAGDRILEIDFQTLNELGDSIHRTLVIEIMGKHSNIILLGPDRRIIDAIRRVSGDLSRLRQVQPGLLYEIPATQEKLNPETLTADELAMRMTEYGGKLSKAIVACVSGFSPQAAMEAAEQIHQDPDALVSNLNISNISNSLYDYFASLSERSPSIVVLSDTGVPADVFPFPQIHLAGLPFREYPSPSQALDSFYSEREMHEHMTQRVSDIAHVIKTHADRCRRKIALQENALAEAARMDEYRRNGELLQANLYQLSKGSEKAHVINYFSESCEMIDIPMDISLSPAQNAQRYFKLYQKARGAASLATEQKKQAEDSLFWLEQMEDDLRKCTTLQEAQEIRDLLTQAGYLKAHHGKNKPRKDAPSKPMRFLSSDGIEIEVGKNALQNERLTMGARGEETWLHAQRMPGSHVIVHAATVPENTLQEAAQLAAFYSKGSHSASVPIDVTLRRYIKKPKGTPAGFVTYTHQSTCYITPDERLVRSLKTL